MEFLGEIFSLSLHQGRPMFLFWSNLIGQYWAHLTSESPNILCEIKTEWQIMYKLSGTVPGLHSFKNIYCVPVMSLTHNTKSIEVVLFPFWQAHTQNAIAWHCKDLSMHNQLCFQKTIMCLPIRLLFLLAIPFPVLYMLSYMQYIVYIITLISKRFESH